MILTKLAAQDIREIVQWYRERSDRAPARFVSELEEIVYSIRQHSKRWPPLAKVDRRRVAYFNRFPYELIYLPTERQIKLLAVRHEKRHPEFGTDRE
ncbi:MAG: plasmid stabilization system protein ParE [Verrucomicrobiales bacterium]